MFITEEDIYHSKKILNFIQENQKELTFRKQKIKRGELLFKQGQQVNDVVFISKGSISLSRSSAQGRRYQLGTFTHNGFLGLMELFSGKTCFYSVQAESECDTFVIDGRAFADLVCRTPELAANTFKHLTSKWYLSVERMTRNILHSISYCVIDDLLQFAKQYPADAYTVNKSLECERLGTSLRVYNRILKHLSDIGAISVSRKSIQILDIPLLISERDIEEEK